MNPPHIGRPGILAGSNPACQANNPAIATEPNQRQAHLTKRCRPRPATPTKIKIIPNTIPAFTGRRQSPAFSERTLTTPPIPKSRNTTPDESPPTRKRTRVVQATNGPNRANPKIIKSQERTMIASIIAKGISILTAFTLIAAGPILLMPSTDAQAHER